MKIHDRLGCSTISFRGLRLVDALATINGLGFAEIDLGALPGVCDHVPYVLDRDAVAAVAAEVGESGLTVRSVNGDVGDLNAVLAEPATQARRKHLDRLLELTSAVGARALVLPNGALDHQPVQTLAADLDRVAAELTYAADRAEERGLELWVESLHLFRLCHDLDRAQLLTDALAGTDVGIVLDVSHIVASGSRIEDFIDRFADRVRHVHLRDATPGNIHHSIGNGSVDFAATITALGQAGYTGHLTLELETRDVADADRPEAALAAGRYISGLLTNAAVATPA